MQYSVFYWRHIHGYPCNGSFGHWVATILVWTSICAVSAPSSQVKKPSRCLPKGCGWRRWLVGQKNSSSLYAQEMIVTCRSSENGNAHQTLLKWLGIASGSWLQIPNIVHGLISRSIRPLDILVGLGSGQWLLFGGDVLQFLFFKSLPVFSLNFFSHSALVYTVQSVRKMYPCCIPVLPFSYFVNRLPTTMNVNSLVVNFTIICVGYICFRCKCS